MYKKLFILIVGLFIVVALFTGCQTEQANEASTELANINEEENETSIESTNEGGNEVSERFTTINHETAREMIDANPSIIVLDVRTPEEHAFRHVNNSILLPVDAINEETAAEVIPSKDTIVIVYCARGNRSRVASLGLYNLGYTNIYDMGGLPNWED